MKILLLESQEPDAQFIQTSLGASLPQAKLSRARAVDEMLRMLDEELFDCLLLDCSLIVSRGERLIEDILQQRSDLRPALIMLSNRGTEDFAARAMRAGAADYLNKSYCSSSLLLAVVRAACHDRAKRLAAIRRNARMAYLATHDALSGLGNRAAWRQDMQLTLKRSSLSDHGFACYLLKLAGLEQLNLRMGRDHGDQAMGLLGQRMAGLGGQQQRFYRLGEDEFCVLQEPLNDAAWRQAWQNRLRNMLTAPLMLTAQGPMVKLAVVIGDACFPGDGATEDALLQRARQALMNDARRSWRALGWRRFMPASDARRAFEPLLEQGLQNIA